MQSLHSLHSLQGFLEMLGSQGKIRDIFTEAVVSSTFLRKAMGCEVTGDLRGRVLPRKSQQFVIKFDAAQPWIGERGVVWASRP